MTDEDIAHLTDDGLRAQTRSARRDLAVARSIVTKGQARVALIKQKLAAFRLERQHRIDQHQQKAREEFDRAAHFENQLGRIAQTILRLYPEQLTHHNGNIPEAVERIVNEVIRTRESTEPQPTVVNQTKEAPHIK